MREIKFRGKRLDNGEWVYGSLNQFEGEATIYDDSDIIHMAHEVDQKTVGQFTGLHDQNGVDIYDGDIINYGKYYGSSEFEGQPCNYVVLYDEDLAGFVVTAILEKEITGNIDANGKIISNIHENRELI